MTGKRFINDIDIGQLIDTKGELSTIDYSDKVDFYELWEFLNKLNDENEQLKEALFFYISVAITETSSHINEDLEKECNQLLKCSYKEALEKYDTSKYEGV